MDNYQDFDITFPVDAVRFYGLLKLAEEAQLADWEKEICLSRMDVVRAYLAELDPYSEEETPEGQELFEKMAQPLIGDNGESVEFSEDHLAWTYDQFLQKNGFTSEAKLEEAKVQVSRYYRDGKPFTMTRWLRIQLDMMKAVDTAVRKGLS